jgi:hypothetical protein
MSVSAFRSSAAKLAKIRSSARRVALVLACAAFAACTAPSYAPSPHSASVPAAVPMQHPSVLGSVEAVTKGQNLYLCQLNVCNVCKAPGTGNVGVGTTSGNPDDAQPGGSILVANRSHREIFQLNSECVETHSPYPDPKYYPNDVAVWRGGLIAVTNESSTSSVYSQGNIKFYRKDGTTYVATGLFRNFYFGAFDAQGDFYNDGIGLSGGAGIGKVPAGSNKDVSVRISGVTSPEGMQFARNGNLNVIDLSCKCIRIYKGTSYVGHVSLHDAVKPISLALNRKNDRVWVTDAATGTVDAYVYPTGGDPVATLRGLPTSTSAFGVGILPASEP